MVVTDDPTLLLLSRTEVAVFWMYKSGLTKLRSSSGGDRGLAYRAEREWWVNYLVFFRAFPNMTWTGTSGRSSGSPRVRNESEGG